MFCNCIYLNMIYVQSNSLCILQEIWPGFFHYSSTTFCVDCLLLCIIDGPPRHTLLPCISQRFHVRFYHPLIRQYFKTHILFLKPLFYSKLNIAAVNCCWVSHRMRLYVRCELSQRKIGGYKNDSTVRSDVTYLPLVRPWQLGPVPARYWSVSLCVAAGPTGGRQESLVASLSTQVRPARSTALWSWEKKQAQPVVVTKVLY